MSDALLRSALVSTTFAACLCTRHPSCPTCTTSEHMLHCSCCSGHCWFRQTACRYPASLHPTRPHCRWGTDYLLKTWRTQAAQNANQTDSIVIAYQVGNWTQESTYWGRPEDLTAQNDPRPAYNVSMLDGELDEKSSQASKFPFLS